MLLLLLWLLWLLSQTATLRRGTRAACN